MGAARRSGVPAGPSAPFLAPPPPLCPRRLVPPPRLLLPRGPRGGDVPSVLPRDLQVGALVFLLFVSSGSSGSSSGGGVGVGGGGAVGRGRGRDGAARPRRPLCPGDRPPREPPPLPLQVGGVLTSSSATAAVSALHPRDPLAAGGALGDEQPRERVDDRRWSSRRAPPARAALDEEEPAQRQPAAEGGVDPRDARRD